MAINEKLMNIQVNIKAPKNLYNSFGKYHYRNAEGICEAVKPYLTEQKCSLTLEDEIIEVGGRIYVKATATITDTKDGDKVSVSAMARESEDKKGMDDSQITGTASSYARKYALNGLFLLDDTKDADTDEYHDTVSNAEVKATMDKAKNYDTSNIPTSEESARGKCTDKQAKFIESLIKQKEKNREEILSKYSGATSFNDLSMSQAKALIDYLTRE